MAIVIAIVLALAALAFVLDPLYRRQGSKQSPASQPAPEKTVAEEKIEVLALEEREQTARDAIQEVELDYQLGNITDADYRSLRERYMQRAMVALKYRFEHEQEIDKEIEEQLRELKESKEPYEKTDQ